MQSVVLITGAAGGIGRATVKVFAEAGWYVIGVDKHKADDIPQVSRFVHADISDPREIEGIFTGVQQQEGKINALVNNAALQICKPLLETTLEEWDQVMAANVRSVFLSVRHAFPLLKDHQGAIINVSSVHAIATSSGLAAYVASKGALLALTRVMALEFGRDGIRVNAILPGAIDTPMLQAGLGRGIEDGRTITELLRGLGRKHVMDRVGQPEEIGRVIYFLADNTQSSFMTGQSIVVDGGATARLSTE